MIRHAACFSIIILISMGSHAWCDTKISALPAASALTGVETFPCVQGGVTDKCTVNQAATFLFQEFSGDCTATSGGALTCSLRAAQLDTLTSLTSATIPQFFYRNAAGNYVASFAGTSQLQFNAYGGQIEISNGTSGSPDTHAGAVVKFSRTGAPAVGSCNNQADSECDTTAAFYAFGLAADTVQTSAVYAGAQGSSTTVGNDAVALLAVGRVTGSGVGLGTGAYLEGRRDTATGNSVGVEIRSNNVTGSDCSYNTTGIGGCDGAWITSSGNGSPHTSSSALHVASADGFAKWASAAEFNTACCITYAIDDESGATNGIYENGTHTYAILTGTLAGKVGFGTLTPAYQLDVAGSTRTTQAFLNSSAVPAISACGTAPPAAAAGSNNNGGQFTTGTAAPTACTVTFANAYPTTAWCTIAPASANAAVAGVYISAQSESAFTVTQPALSSTKYNYTCMGN